MALPVGPERMKFFDPEMSPEKIAERKKKYNLETLKFHVNALNEMLKDPEWGLASWCMVYAEHIKYIHDYWEYN